MPVSYGAGITRNRTIFAQKNKLDRCTIVSIYPREINHENPTIFPSTFHIDAGNFEDPSVLMVESSSWFKNDYQSMEAVEVPTGSVLVAQSIIEDWAKGLVGCSFPTVMPGLFFVEGEHTKNTIKKHEEYPARIEIARQKQDAWYKVLVEIADVDWARTGGNPRSIGNDSRLAAERLGLKDKPWMANYESYQLSNCPACGFRRNSLYPICSNCHTILDKAKYDKLGLSQEVKVVK